MQRRLDHPLQGACPIGRIIALVGQPFDRILTQLQGDSPVGKKGFKAPDLDRDNARHVRALEAVEQDHLINAVEKFRTEIRPNHCHDLLTHRADIFILTQIHQIFRTQVRRHDDQRVAEVDGTALPIGQTAIIKHLQQYVEDIGMRLFDLVEEHDLVGPAPNRLGQRPTFVITDIAGRRANQTRYGVLLHIFRHVEPDHGAVIIEQVTCKRLGQLGLANARGSQEHERTHRPVGILQTGPCTAHGTRDGLNRLTLPHNPLGKFIFHAQKFIFLAFKHLVDGNAGPARNYLRNVIGRHSLFDHRVHPAFTGSFGFCKLLLKLRDHPIGKLTRLGEIAAALCLFKFHARMVNFFLDVARA